MASRELVTILAASGLAASIDPRGAQLTSLKTIFRRLADAGYEGWLINHFESSQVRKVASLLSQALSNSAKTG